ncbi:PTS sugar transporter subunit IIA [Enterococcus sp. 669A]|uniref:Mannitol-specific phosphotransferase enzyme IIA component n=1 Tax=Candidatus Enterococcus moelleringii TaxID=2815325 RepID=A0ABS3LGA1_9ENTE|nr:PTS sugar transporter subunit IIA [Enterococcus sp. 669A]MBO1308676.1 PTS sugar transporter subunit IIA [Enterococcus sp. 669A]
MSSTILKKENIVLNVGQLTKEAAINKAGRLLVESGYVSEAYVKGMFEREEVFNTYIGNGVAIPHGVSHSKDEIKESGIVVLQSKEGIDYGDEKAYLVIGIAGIGDEHLDILSSIALTVQDESNVQKAVESDSVDEVYELLTSEL